MILSGVVERAMRDNPAAPLIEKIRRRAEDGAQAASEAMPEPPGADEMEAQIGRQIGSDEAEETAETASEPPPEPPKADEGEPQAEDEAAPDHAEEASDAPRSRVNAKLVAEVVAEAGGILGEMVDWMVATARYPQPLLALGASIATIGALMGHRYRLLDGPDTRSNVMILAIAGSGSGKEHSRKCVAAALHEAGLEAYFLGRDTASAQGIHGALANQFCGVMMVDEFGLVLANAMHDRAPAHLRAIAKLLMELATSSTGIFMDETRAMNRDPDATRFDIPDPCFCLFGTTTPEPLWKAVTSGQAVDGFLARFLVLQTPENYPDPQFGTEPLDQRLLEIARKLQLVAAGPGADPDNLDVGIASALGSVQPRWEDQGKGRLRRAFSRPVVPVVPMTAGAKDRDLAIEIQEVRAKRANEGKSLGTSIIARTTEHVRRLALIRAVSMDPKAPAVTVDDMQWARKVVQLSQRLLLAAIEEHVADTPWEANLKKLLRIIQGYSGWIDGTTLNNRCKFLTSKDRDQALRQLEDSGLIESKTERTATKPRRYYRSV
jgi:hypothetical protein